MIRAFWKTPSLRQLANPTGWRKLNNSAKKYGEIKNFHIFEGILGIQGRGGTTKKTHRMDHKSIKINKMN